MIVGIALNEMGKCTYKMGACVWGGGGGRTSFSHAEGGGGSAKSLGPAIFPFCFPSP